MNCDCFPYFSPLSRRKKIEKTAPSKAPEAAVPMRQRHGEAGFSFEKMKLSFLPAYL
jgi:hypothetical protein